jgi:large repetitive protein
VRRLTLIFLAYFFLLTLCLPPSANAQTSGSALNRWTRTGDLTAARSAACAAVLNDGRLLVAGGLGDSGSVAAVDIYGTDGAFIAGAPMTHARAHAACVTLADGRVLVAGGNDGSGSLNSAEIFDPSTNQWQPTGNLSVAREGHRMAMTSWGFAWVAGGNSNGAITGTLELFNPDTGQFQAVGSLNTARAEFAMTAVGRSLVIAGGTDGNNTLSSVEIYDGSLGTLTVAGAMSQARKDFAAAALLDGTILMTGGVDANGVTLTSTEIFDPVKGTSTGGPSLLAPRAFHSAYAMPHNGSVLIYGGVGNSSVLSTTELYTPWTGNIAQGSALNSARRDEATAGLRAGSYMIAGGRDDLGFLSGSELFQFSTIRTDKGDYAPGTAVKISGGGWVPGEQVLVTLTAFPVDQHHIEFTGAAVADGAGNISVPGFAVDKSHLGMKFLMTAMGSQSQAQATFTDGIDPTISYTFSPASGTATPGTPVTVTVTLTPPSPANPAPTGTIVPCSPVLGCPTTLTVSGVHCDSTPICTLSPGAGNTATVSFTILFPAGTTTFSIEYSGDSNYNFEVPTSGATPPGAPVVNYTSQNFTVTDLTGGPVSPATFGTQTPYVANVCISATSGGACLGSGTLSGKVQFFVGGVALGSPVSIVPTGSNTGKGTASFIPNPPLAIGGPYVITATYGNDFGNAGSNSTAANGGAASISTTIIGKIDPTISYTFNPASGAATPGTPVTVTVTLTPPSPASPTPTGTIVPCSPVLGCPTALTVTGASCNSTPQCTLSAGTGNTATASFNILFPAGTTTFSIQYSGDSNYNFEVPASGATPPGAPVVNYTSQNFTVTDLTGGPVSPAAFGTQTAYVANVCIAATSGGACIGSGTLSGKVQFLVNGAASGSPVSIVPTGSNTGRGTANFIPNPPLAVGGPYVITATYGNDLGNAGSNSTAANGGAASISTTIIGKIDPTISYTFNPPSGAATPGTPVTVTVTLTPPSPASPTPTGTIVPCSPVLACPTTLTVSGAHCNSTPICTLSPGAGNTATVSFNISFPAGTTTFSVQYSGDSNYNFEVPASGATPPGAPVVNYTSQNFTVTDLTGGPVSPANFGTQTPYVANVCIAATSGGACIGSGTLSGKVQFLVNGVASGSPVSIVPTGSNTGKGTASFIPNPPLAVGGPYVITATYGNDLGNAGSNSTAANGGAASISTTIIGKIDPIISYTFNPASGAATPGTPVTVTVTLTPPSPASPTPTGAIIPCSPVVGCPTTLPVSGAHCNSTPLCTLSPGAGNTATVSFTISFPAGTTTFSVQYSGDSNYNFEVPVSGATPPGAPVVNYTEQTVTGPVPAGSSLTVTVSPNPAQVNQAITISINVLGTNGGSSSPTGTVTLSDNGVVIGVNPVVAAVATFTVTLGPGSHTITAVYSGDSIYPSSTASYGLTVAKPAPTTTFTSSNSISVFGQPVTFSATLKGATGLPTPTGTVQFLANGVPLGSPVTLVNGAATLTTSSLPPGANVIAVQYSGDNSYSSSTVNGGTVIVSQAQVTTTLAVTTAGAQMTLTATLKVVSPGSGTPTGIVKFLDTVTGSVLGAATVSGGSVSVTIPVTSDAIVAVYSGDANFLPSTSASATAATITALNAASDVAAFSPDTIVSIYGSGLTTKTLSGTLPLQSTLGGITVTVTDSAGVPRQALLFFVSPGQINLLIPAGTATGPATVTVNTAGGSLTTTVNISASIAALFTANNNGSGPLAAQVVAVAPGGQQTYTNTAALSGTTFVNAPMSLSPAADTFYLLLYGTGFDTAKTVAVTINGKTFTPAYFGPQGGFAGLDQVNVLLPASMAGSGQVNVSITVDGQTSNVGTVAFGTAGTN